MNFFFRVDASLYIGSGHVVRCLTLAKALKKKGAYCKFICKSHQNNLIKKIKKENFDVATIPNFTKNNSTPIKKKKGYSNWLESTWKEDVNQTIDILNKKKKIDWLIIDHYGIDKRWEKRIRPYTKKIMVIDDLANRNHDCDLLLDQNLVDNFKNRYKNLVSKNCITFLGPKYALLQSEYSKLHLTTPLRIGPSKNILIYFGASDRNNLTYLTLALLLKLNKNNITINIVIGSNSLQNKKIKELSKKNTNIKVYNNLKSLAYLMTKADLAIGACGTTTWERCCVGLPSIVITVASNQKAIAKELHKLGLIRWLGHKNKITKKLFFSILKECVDLNLKIWSGACKLVTDGSGAEKIASILTFDTNVNFKLRYADYHDEELLFNWANDPLVRKNALNSRNILPKKHNKWFFYQLKNSKSCKILIGLTDKNLPLGQVRINKVNKKWIIDFSVAEFARKKNIGFKLLKKAIKKFKREGIVDFLAKVKVDNVPSSKIFKKIGFIKKRNKNKIITFFYKNEL